MAYIPLVEHTHPRVLMLDFSPQEVAKVQKAGFEVRRGATGLHDRNEFCFPFATQDVEVLFGQVQRGSFTTEERTASNDSVEERPFFRDLIRETWRKPGWVILFIAQDTPPEELKAIGLERLGIIPYGRHHIPESTREPLLQAIEEHRRLHEYTDIEEYEKFAQMPPPPSPQIPRFRGQDIYTADEAEMAVLQRYIKSARMSVLTCLRHPLGNHSSIHRTPQPHVVAFGEVYPINWLIRDNSTDENIMALKLDHSLYEGKKNGQPTYKQGSILLLPDFGDNNGNIALALLQEAITQISPHLFDTPQHPWLEKYQPEPILRLHSERKSIVEEARQKIKQIDEQIEAEREQYSWLLGLLVSIGDQFATDVAHALRFLGFAVEEVDNSLAPGERKREDFRISDAAVGYFALGEAKTTGGGRGAAEEFITKTQTHQARYSKENQRVSPPALLIVNYALDLDPVQRAGRFYQSEVIERLEDNSITALNSVALFELCQSVLNGKLSTDQVRRFITSGQALIVSIISIDVVAANKHPAS